MTPAPFTVLVRPATFWHDVRDGQAQAHHLLSLAVFIVAACGVYGAIMAGWRSPRLALYVAIKLPLMFLVTTLIVSVFNWITAMALGCRLRYPQALFLAAGAMTIAGWVLLALAPVSLLVILSGVPSSGPADELRYAHNVMLLTHITILAGAGLAGNVRLMGWLRDVAPSRTRARLLLGVWLAAYAFVGCQCSWILRPFVGSPFYPVVFLRPDALERNFYEFVCGDVLPYVLHPLIARAKSRSCNKRFGGRCFCRQSFGAVLTHLAQGNPSTRRKANPEQAAVFSGASKPYGRKLHEDSCNLRVKRGDRP